MTIMTLLRRQLVRNLGVGVGDKPNLDPLRRRPLDSWTPGARVGRLRLAPGFPAGTPGKSA
jgi:hypothetical protein